MYIGRLYIVAHKFNLQFCHFFVKRQLNLRRGGSRGRVQGVRTPLRDDKRLSNITGILQKKNYVVYWR